MRKRLAEVEETRRRIVEAAVELHGSVGPANTTFSAVAERAGVQRSTVYRHFPDEEALFGACTSHWLARHPWPRPEDWAEEADPSARLRRALRDLYRYYEQNREMIANSFRDIDVMPPFVGEFMRAHLAEIHRVLLEPWPRSLQPRLGPAVAHAMDFRSWQSLADAGLGAREAAELMADMVGCLSR
jgi:AcrR family transcriptional regulator